MGDVSKSSPINDALCEQVNIIEELNHSVNELEKILSSVRSARPEGAGKDGEKYPEDHNHNSPIFNSIKEHNRLLRRIRENINYLISDVDL